MEILNGWQLAILVMLIVFEIGVAIAELYVIIDYIIRNAISKKNKNEHYKNTKKEKLLINLIQLEANVKIQKVKLKNGLSYYVVFNDTKVYDNLYENAEDIRYSLNNIKKWNK